MITTLATIGSVSRDILTEVAPDELDRLPQTAGRIFAGGDASQQALRQALEGPMVAGLLLTILNGVACGLLTDSAADRADRNGWLGARMRDRSRRNALTDHIAAAGPATQLPSLSAVQSARVGAHVLGLARNAGITGEVARRLATHVEAALQPA